jgi:hypothetical protein
MSMKEDVQRLIRNDKSTSFCIIILSVALAYGSCKAAEHAANKSIHVSPTTEAEKQ